MIPVTRVLYDYPVGACLGDSKATRAVLSRYYRERKSVQPYKHPLLIKTRPYSILQVPTTQLAKMSFDLKSVELTADVLELLYIKHSCALDVHVRIMEVGHFPNVAARTATLCQHWCSRHTLSTFPPPRVPKRLRTSTYHHAIIPSYHHRPSYRFYYTWYIRYTRYTTGNFHRQRDRT